ncbi:MAG: Smr/MutS family protein [Treponema sp.]|jgi:DNA mismatch repair protein MutS2|nr:Smr/MutS family protein [Treponema sp.]
MAIEGGKSALMEKTLRLLEYGGILRAVAENALSEEAAGELREERPRFDPAAVAEIKALVSAVRDRINSGDEEPRGSLPAIAGILPKLAVEGASLGIEEAWALGIFIDRGTALKTWLAGPGGSPGGLPDSGGPLKDALSRLPDCGAAGREIFRVIDRAGKLRDLPEFRAIKKRFQTLVAELDAAVARYTGSEEGRKMLQSPVPTQRDGRMVLAVKANFRGRLRGIVHEASATGQTIFVEPEEVVEKNNKILVENRRLDAEILRVLREMTGRLAEHRDALGKFHRGIISLECVRAKARYSRIPGCVFAAEGRAEEGPGSLALKQARHPLLGGRAVPIDLEMDGRTRTVIITGPNTGGKTVALKTAGLFALMNQSGLALPAAEGTVFPVFDGIYADIGDEQSISQSLSTFSAHMTNIAGITEAATEQSLVLLDELGSGTDPEEGSAIAMAILDYLIEKKPRLVATTHHGVLKNYGYTREGVENASMEFDGRTLSPTYRIVMGIPGESRAVDVAARNHLPPRIIERARSYLDEERSDVSALIRGLRDKHRELDAATEKGRAEEERLREERRRSDLRELRLRQKETEIKAGVAGNLRLLLAESRKKLENLVREIREGELDREKTRGVKEFLRDLARTVEAEDAALEEETRLVAEERRRIEAAYSGGPDSAGRSGGGGAAGRGTGGSGGAAPVLAPGVDVLAGENRRRGRVIRQDRKGAGGGEVQWLVEIGSLKMSFPEKDLIPLPPPAENRKPLIAAAEVSAPPAQFEISLRGRRLEEALELLRRQIDGALLAGLKTFSVVHGKGDGILQRGVHEYLKKDTAVADYYFSRPELGGFGRTEVVLKG